MAELSEMRKLKMEENALINILAHLKNQLNRLKIEEMIIESKRREKSVVTSATGLSGSPSIPSTSSEVHDTRPEEVNQLKLNLFPANSKSGMLADPQNDDEDEEMESEDDDDENYNPLTSFLDF